MARINLLPWREERRKYLQQQFLITVAVFIVITLCIWGGVHLANNARIQYQNVRIQFLQTHINNIEKKIEEIKALEKEKQKLKSRIGAIEQLQTNRPLIVLLFDELMNSLPDGVSIISIKQNNDVIAISGVAESNARVSSFMRKLEESEWLGSAKLDVIEAKSQDDRRISNFTMSFKQLGLSSEDEDAT